MEEKTYYGLPTGYPSVDKPWLKYYSDETPELPSSDMSMYDFLLENNKDNLNSIALNYFGRKISYQELFENIDKVASSLCAYGVKQGDIVSVCPLNTPEFIYLLYAINKIGAVSNWIGLTSPEQDIREQLLKTETKMVFAVSIAYDAITQAAKGTLVERIISVPIENSMTAIMCVMAGLKNRSSNGKVGDAWKSFLKAEDSQATKVTIKGRDLAIIEYTGGSTGVPKGVMLSNISYNAHYLNFNKTNLALLHLYERIDTYLSGVPLFLAMGVSACCHAPLCHGMELILAPDPSPEAGIKLIVKNRVNHTTTGRLLLERIAKEAGKKTADYSFIKSIVYGGEERNTVWEEGIKKELLKAKITAPIINGYGLSETSGGILLAKEDAEGLVPNLGVNIKITNPDNPYEEYKYDSEGELCVNTDQLMLGYYKNDKETDNAFFDADGIRWLRTRDLATISQDGIIKITGRIKRIYSKTGSDRIQVRVYPVRIEEVILSDDGVQQCAVVGVKDDITAYRSIAYIVLADPAKDKDDAKERIDALCRKKLPDSHIPDEYIFVTDFPLTRAGKVDYRELERRAAGEKENE